MKLLHLIICLCFVMPLAGALDAAKAARAGSTGYALAVIVGLLLGSFCTWTTWTVGKAIVTSVLGRPDYSDSRKDWVARGMFFSTLLWIVFAFILGEWASSTLIRLTT